MESHPQSNVLLTHHRKQYRDTGVTTEEMVYINREIPLQKAMWGGSCFCNATIMYRTDFLLSHVNLDEFIARRFNLQDWPTWVILSAYTDFDILPISTATWCMETISITRPDTYERLEKRYQGDAIVYEYLCELFPEQFPFDKVMWNQYIASQLLSLAYRKGDYRSAKKYAALAGRKSIKVLCTKCCITFYLFVILKRLKAFLKRKGEK